MAINDVIKREQGEFLDEHGEFEHYDPMLETMFEQHACMIPNTDTMLVRQAPALFTGDSVPADMDRNKNMFIPELLNGVVIDQNHPDFVGFPTPDVVPLDPNNPDHVLIGRKGPKEVQLPTPAGPVEVWPFEDSLEENPPDEPPWPSKPIRVREGQLVHTELGTRHSTHTIHHHAIEPSAMNDGVGHITFEVGSGKYSYQWLASDAGTYFYHCHKNTTLHFEMGMYGMLIIDPPAPAGSDLSAPYATGGPGYVRRRNEMLRYDREAIWAVDEFDLTWRTRALAIGGHSVGIECPWYHVDENGNPIPDAFNPGLNQFNPEVFLISGIADSWTMPADPNTPDGRPPAFDNGAAIIATQGERVLLRLLNAGYCTQRYTFGVPFEVVAADGRTFGYEHYMSYSEPFTVGADTRFALTTARRWDMILDTATLAPGSYPVEITFHDWITNEQKGALETVIIIQ